MANYNKEIAEWLTAQRKAKRLTQSELGQRLGVTKTAISYWENGKRELSAENFISICKALDADPYELVRELMKIA